MTHYVIQDQGGGYMMTEHEWSELAFARRFVTYQEAFNEAAKFRATRGARVVEAPRVLGFDHAGRNSRDFNCNTCGAKPGEMCVKVDTGRHVHVCG